ERRYAQRRYAAAPVAPQLPSRRRRCRHKASLPINQRRELAASHNLPNGYVLPCYHFHVGLDSSQSIKNLRTSTLPPWNKQQRPIFTGDGGAVQGRHSDAAPGDLHGGHRCRELLSAHCLYPRFSLLRRRLRMIAGSIAAPSRMAPANGAAATTIARATPAFHRLRAAG